MKTITTTLYQYDEASEELKEKIIEKHRDINVDYPDWSDFILDYFKEELDRAGIDNPEILYSGFYSQGDGLSFTSRWINLEKLMEYTHANEKYPGIFQALKDGRLDYSCYIERTGAYHYVHGRSATLIIDSVDNLYDDEKDEEAYFTLENILNKELDDLKDYLNQWREDTCSDFYYKLEKEFEYLCSDEAVIETIQANEYYFDDEGNIR